MAKITINRENFKVDERELEQGTLSVGRASDNDLHIDDPAVSNHHAKIVTVFDSCYVEDLNSTNGTFVNGQRVKTHTLHNGDVLTIGHYQILFQGKSTTNLQDANSTMMIGVSQLEELTKKARQARPAAVPQHRPAAHPEAHQAKPQQAASPRPTNKPKLEVHENNGQIIADETELPSINDEDTQLLDRTQRVSPSPRMYNRRKSDLSPLPSLKVIVLAVLATVATFTLLMLFFR